MSICKIRHYVSERRGKKMKLKLLQDDRISKICSLTHMKQAYADDNLSPSLCWLYSQFYICLVISIFTHFYYTSVCYFICTLKLSILEAHRLIWYMHVYSFKHI